MGNHKVRSIAAYITCGLVVTLTLAYFAKAAIGSPYGKLDPGKKVNITVEVTTGGSPLGGVGNITSGTVSADGNSITFGWPTYDVLEWDPQMKAYVGSLFTMPGGTYRDTALAFRYDTGKCAEIDTAATPDKLRAVGMFNHLP